MIGMVKDSVLGLGLSTSKDPCGLGQRGLAPGSTGASSEECAASPKEVPAGERSGEATVCACAANHFNSFRLGRFASGRETRTVPGWSGRYNRANS